MAAEQADDVRVDVASVPDIAEAEMDFRDTSFFQSGDPSVQLPSPASILRQYPGKATGNVRFEHLNLLVKMGYWYHVRFEEVQTLRAMRQVFANNEVPVPEVFGWRKHGNMCFIYMSLIPGQTLDQAWPTLTNEDKVLICADLSRIVGQLRRLVQGSSGNCFVGKDTRAHTHTHIVYIYIYIYISPNTRPRNTRHDSTLTSRRRFHQRRNFAG